MSPLHARKLHPRISKWFLSFQLGSILGRSSNDFEALRVENRRHDPSLSFSSPPREKRFSLQAIVSNHRASNRKQIRSSVLSPYISRACPFYLFSFFHSFFLLLFPDVWTASIALVNLNAIGHETKRSEQVAREYARARDRERVRTHAHARVEILPPSLSFQRPEKRPAHAFKYRIWSTLPATAPRDGIVQA